VAVCPACANGTHRHLEAMFTKGFDKLSRASMLDAIDCKNAVGDDQCVCPIWKAVYHATMERCSHCNGELVVVNYVVDGITLKCKGCGNMHRELVIIHDDRGGGPHPSSADDRNEVEP